MENKPASNLDPLPQGLIRLAAVLAEIAQNEEKSALNLKSPIEEKVEELDENPKIEKTDEVSRS